MKKIEAIVRPSKLDDVKNALCRVGVEGITVSEVRGHGRQGGKPEMYRGAEYVVDFQPKVKVEVVTGDREAPAILAAIVDAAGSGHFGDGKIFVSNVSYVVRIRTGAINEAAI